MGLFLDRFSFGDRPVPTRAELEESLRASVGGIGSLEGYDVLADGRVELRCMLEPVTHAYALAFLVGRGGVRTAFDSSEPVRAELPWFVSRPWRDWPWTRRWGIVLGFHGGLFATAVPGRRPRT